MEFKDFGLSEPIMKALGAKNYSVPTPIQQQAIPIVLSGKDLCGIAQTGTGKTAAFALPTLDRLASNTKYTPPLTCRVLVLSPTRELAAQIGQSFRDYGRFMKLNVATVFGGVPIHKQIRQLSQGVDVLVATPGRLIDIISQKAFHLKGVEVLILDEADQMMDMGFIHPVKQIVSFVPKERQTLFFSATMPKEIAALAKQFLNDPATVSVTPPATTAERIVQRAFFVNQNEKQALLTHIVRTEDIDRALIFTRTKYGADKVVRALAGAGIHSAAIHGDKSQGQRTAALQAFRAGQVKLLVATDIAARGIDVSGISHVINFEIPNNPDQYVHRIGRTARAGREGLAISLVADDERSYLKAIERLTRTTSEIAPLPEGMSELVRSLPKPAPRKQADARPPRPQQMREKQPRQHRERGERGEQGDNARSFHPRRKKTVGAYKGAVQKIAR